MADNCHACDIKSKGIMHTSARDFQCVGAAKECVTASLCVHGETDWTTRRGPQWMF